MMMLRLLWSFVVLSLVLLDQTEGWRRRRRRRCPRTNCAVSSWTSWSTCTRSCGVGTQYRTRRVTRGPSCGGSCPYGLRETQNCHRQNCPVNGGWSSWSGWNSCSQSCGTGSQKRSRSCTKPPPRYGGKSCPGSSQQGQLCNRNPCPVNGGWSSWGGWASCSKSCGTGSQERSRSCTKPPPRYGGKSCPGTAREKQLCNKQPCPVNGGWSSWGVWTTCSKPCGSGTQARTRSCTQPRPQNGGKTCPGKATEQRRCNTHSCPVHGGWSAWFVSTSCSVTCGRGVEVLSRTCTNPAPKHGGRPCSGDARKNQVCVKQHCPINGGWSRWSAWSSCSHSCGTAGSRERSRSCTHPAPQHGGKVCAGAAKERQVCNRRHCPVDGGWSSWGAWTTCTKPCESGTQTRTRSCTRPRPRHGGKNCPGAAKEQRVCNTHSCPVDGGWSSWGGWASCSQSCGTGSQERSRSCTQPAPKYGGKSCPGAARENRLCNKQLCPVDGGWSSWGVWTTCTKPCESGTQARTRSCTQPPPKNGGETCPGAAMERRVCNTHSCPVHGGWSDWFVSTPCSVSCGSGIEVLSRTCTNPAPKHGGRRCQGNARKDQACAQKPCPVDGGWSDWTGWTSCSTSCGTGFRERSRSCTQPAPKFGGKTCPGAARESHGCNTHSCPVHGGWSGWSSWSPCGKTCGGGLRERTRSCTNPPPYYGGRGCGTHYYESKQCAMNTCPVDGGWSSWSGWSSCSKSCGTGFLERSRSCTQPAPSSGGKPCPGADKESSWCNSHACPVDGGWSAWSSWSSCGKTCGGGQRERTRSCTNPPPYYGGRGCGNHYHESKECAVNKCPVDGGWSEWGNWTECSVTCGIGVESRERKCDDPAPSAGGRPCQGYSRDVKSCNTTKICIDRVGCYGNFHSTFLGSFRDEIQWFAPPFSKQMQKMVDKCARLAVTKGLRYFAVENFGNCYGANDYSSGGEPTAFECNFGVGLENFFFIYKVST